MTAGISYSELGIVGNGNFAVLEYFAVFAGVTTPVKELAKLYGLTPNAVSLRLHKTREKLRLHLEEGGYTV